MVSVFAREITDELASLVRKLDDLVDKHESKQMKAFVVLLSDDPDEDESKLKALAKKHNIENVPLTIFDGVAGPPNYKIAENAAVTVMMWRKLSIEANQAFGDGDFDKKAIKAVLKDTDKILN